LNLVIKSFIFNFQSIFFDGGQPDAWPTLSLKIKPIRNAVGNIVNTLNNDNCGSLIVVRNDRTNNIQMCLKVGLKKYKNLITIEE
jgi:hypothetical protein